MVVIFKAPAVWLDEHGRDGHLLDRARQCAASVTPVVASSTIYQSIVQCKLDALLFDEDTYHWIQIQTGRTPAPRQRRLVVALRPPRGVAPEPSPQRRCGRPPTSGGHRDCEPGVDPSACPALGRHVIWPPVELQACRHLHRIYDKRSSDPQAAGFH